MSNGFLVTLLVLAVIVGGSAIAVMWQWMLAMQKTIERLQVDILRAPGAVAAPSGTSPTSDAKVQGEPVDAPGVPPMPQRPFISVVQRQPTPEEQIKLDLPVIVAAVAYYLAGTVKAIRVYAPAHIGSLWGLSARFDHRRTLRVGWDRVYQATSESGRQWFKFW